MSSTVRNLLEAAGLGPRGIVARGQPIPVAELGVYLVSAQRRSGGGQRHLPSRTLNSEGIAELLRERPELTVGAARGTPQDLPSE